MNKCKIFYSAQSQTRLFQRSLCDDDDNNYFFFFALFSINSPPCHQRGALHYIYNRRRIELVIIL